MNLFSSGCVLFDCSEGAYRMVEKTPFKIGSGDDCDWRIDDPQVAAEHCVIQRKSHTYYLLSSAGTEGVLLDGMLNPGGQLAPNTDHTLIIGKRLFALRVGSALEKWTAGMNSTQWFIFDKTNSSTSGPVAFHDLAIQLPRAVANVSDAVFLCRGLTTMGFYAEHVLPLIPPPLPEEKPAPQRPPAPQEDTSSIDTEYGEFTCPVCWLKFDRGDTMNVAVHAFLRGDPILGEAHMQRFHATRFNDRGQAVDAMNITTTDLACPHCRRKLPPGFLDGVHHIFSIVGAPSSGKSYYLSILIKVLQNILFQQFGVTFRDADPSENVILNQMKIQLFSASTPQDAVLAKTELEGAMYETLPRLGRPVRLPKPFIFNLSSQKDPSEDFSVVFYDNAGEHFEPTRNSADSPGAQHIAAASGIFFLFDPLHNTEFRHRLTGINDPQINLRRVDQQDIILAETEVRIKSLLGLDSRQRIATPLAVIVGKSDTWLHLLGDQQIQYPIKDGRLNVQTVQQNSDIVRKLLLDLCPAIVANAEAISSEVMYFAASPLGCSPVEFEDSRGNRMIGPDPQKLNPQHVEVPTLWVLSRIVPSMVPAAEVKT
jgi:FHA domain